MNSCNHSFIYTVKNSDRCYYCWMKMAKPKEKCPNCNGLGEIVYHHPFNDYEEDIKMCDTCDGTGLKRDQ